MKKVIKILILFLLLFYFQTSLFAEEKSSSSSEQKIEIDLTDPKNVGFTLEEIKKIHKYAVPIDKINLLGVDVANKEKHLRIKKDVDTYHDDDIAVVEVVFADNLDGGGVQKLIDNYNIEKIKHFYYTAPSEGAYFRPDYDIDESIEEQLKTGRFRNQSIRLYLEVIDRYTSFERDGRYISENSKKGFHDKMEYLYQLYHRGVIVKTMHFAVFKKHVNPILKETGGRLVIGYNSSLHQASKKKTFQSKMHTSGDENILGLMYFGDSTQSGSHYLKNSIQTNFSELYLSNSTNSNIVPSFQSWAPESGDLSYDLENIRKDSINGTIGGSIVSHFFWNDFSSFRRYNRAYEHDIRVNSMNFIDCKDTHEFPDFVGRFVSDNLECSPSSVRFVGEDGTIPREYWYVDTRNKRSLKIEN